MVLNSLIRLTVTVDSSILRDLKAEKVIAGSRGQFASLSMFSGCIWEF